MVDKCKVCHQPIYPYGVSYTGLSCMYGGNHPQVVEHQNLPVRELITSIDKLTKAVERLHGTRGNDLPTESDHSQDKGDSKA